MCDECRRIAGQIPNDAITAIEAHRSDLIALLTEVNNAANAEDVKRALDAAKARGGEMTAESLALWFAPYVVGFLCGGKSSQSSDLFYMIEMFNSGMTAGQAWANKGGH